MPYPKSAEAYIITITINTVQFCFLDTRWLIGSMLKTPCLISVSKSWILPLSAPHILQSIKIPLRNSVTQNSFTDYESKLMGAVTSAFYCWRKQVCTTDLLFFITSFINNLISATYCRLVCLAFLLCKQSSHLHEGKKR